MYIQCHDSNEVTSLSCVCRMKWKILCVKIGKRLADILTRSSSHPQGKSEARGQNMHLFIVNIKGYM